ncbi:DHHC family palmitoyl transferase [Cryptosporidium ubiquitum]|uniref:Palmitoyltransferase n=1 Tax=Cryptosporidium ubiquitum TaxID=857276 RepID=A0A1J4MNY1_9CRYT|nr:DHHC family palmitoyl transferase [Cryptosporidium ubiquitum]OII74581.1 DHHC family palmitoyl transferase [Cryptosporidium ubiquitum]
MAGTDDILLENSSGYDKFRRKALTILPVIFVVTIIMCLYLIYTFYHIIPLIEEDSESGIAQVVFFNIFVLMTLICFVLSILTKPGEIPNTPEWSIKATEGRARSDLKSKELKSNGERRYCKWCAKYKPDRTHHCRVCRTCVLKMDHHCPWISNCVGWGNHKHLLLLIFYSAISCSFITITLAPTLNTSLNMSTIRFGDIVALLLAEILSAFLVVVLFSFFFFHLWLVFNSMTTIEFCEKSRSTSYTNLWFKGYMHSFKQVFGSNPFLWFLPVGNQVGDGINFDHCHRLEADVQSNDFKGRSNTTSNMNATVVVDCQPKIAEESSLLLSSEQESNKIGDESL